MRFLLSFLILSLHLATLPQALAGERPGPRPWEYRLGEGLRVGRTDIRLGGYISLKYLDRQSRRGRFVFDDLSLFVYGNITDKWRFFSEWEDTHFFQIDTEGRSRTSHHGELERLYSEYEASDIFKLKLGKFLTPVGTWNEIHADPLTWTVSRPLVTFATFPEYISGIGLSGEVLISDEEFGYALFAQNNESIDEETGFRKTHEVYGVRFRWFDESGLEVGIPILFYEEYMVGDKIYLTGLDILYRAGGLEVRAEGVYSWVDSGGGDDSREYGYYIQGVKDLTERLSIVARHDYLHARSRDGQLRVLSLGTAYKLRPQIVFKVEYQIRSGDLHYRYEDMDIDNSERVLASFSVLF